MGSATPAKAFLCAGAVAIGVHLLRSNDLAIYDAIALASAGLMLVAAAGRRPRLLAGWLARDAMTGGGTLAISVRRDGDSAVLVVADQGTGIDDETRARVFEPYYTTKPVGRGSGLGLSTVHGIVGQSGGSVEVASTVGVGTTFTVRLPLSSGRVVARAAAR